jgi:NAD(P)-dependent dehydrogenase (short-subunit alcohol dehydrogenase family)
MMIEQAQTTTAIDQRVLGTHSGQTPTRIESRPPIGRLGSVQEVAATVCWLRSDQAPFITAATIPVDGGLLAGGA